MGPPEILRNNFYYLDLPCGPEIISFGVAPGMPEFDVSREAVSSVGSQVHPRGCPPQAPHLGSPVPEQAAHFVE